MKNFGQPLLLCKNSGAFNCMYFSIWTHFTPSCRQYQSTMPHWTMGRPTACSPHLSWPSLCHRPPPHSKSSRPPRSHLRPQSDCNPGPHSKHQTTTSSQGMSNRRWTQTEPLILAPLPYQLSRKTGETSCSFADHFLDIYSLFLVTLNLSFKTL